MSIASVLFERAQAIKHHLRERIATANALEVAQKARRRFNPSSICEPLEQRVLLSTTPTATLSIIATPDIPADGGGIWTAYLAATTDDNAGLATFGIDVIGSNGLTVTDSVNDAASQIRGVVKRQSGTKIVNNTTVSVIGTFNAGFDSFNSDGTAGVGITSSQTLLYGASGANNAVLDSLVYQGVGQIDRADNAQATADYDASGTNMVPDWRPLTDIASGTYSGNAGTLTVSPHPGYSIQYLIGTGPGTWSGPANVGAYSVAPGYATLTTTPTNTVVTSDSASPSYGQRVTFTATVTPSTGGGETGTVDFFDGVTQLNSSPVTLINGIATFSTSALTTGIHSLTADYSGDNNFTRSTSAALVQTISQVATSTAVATSNPTPTYGQSVTITAAVTPASNSGETGTVDFFDGMTQLNASPVALDNDIATFSTSALTTGTHSITAVYSGDTNFTSSTSPALSQTISQVATSTVVTTNNPTPTYGQSVTFIAAVAPASNSGETGTVNFFDGVTQLNASPVLINNGVATYTASGLNAGSHTITALYSGDDNFSTSTSPTLTQNVAKATTSIVLTFSNTTSYGQPLTFTVAVTPGTGNGETGTVNFFDGATQLNASPVALTNGIATFSTSYLTAGLHSISAMYSGDSNFGGITGYAGKEVFPAPTTITVTSSNVSASSGQPVTFTAAVTPASGAGETGNVNFFDGAIQLNASPVPLNNGIASYTTSALTSGNHSIDAVYSGDKNFSSSTSHTLTQTVSTVLIPDSWTGNGDGRSWEDANNWSLGIVPDSTNIAIIDSLGTTVGISSTAVVGAVSSTANLNISGGSLTVTSAASSISGSLTVDSGASLIATGAGTTFTATEVTTVNGGSLFAIKGGQLNLPNLRTFSAGANSTLEADGTGSDLELIGLTTVNNADANISDNLQMNAYGGGVLNVSGIVPAEISNVRIKINDNDNSTFNDGGLKLLQGVFIRTDGTDTNFLSPLTSLTNSTLSLYGGNVTLPNLSNIDGTSIDVSNGASLRLPAVSSYNADFNNGSYTDSFGVSGTGSHLVLNKLANLTDQVVVLTISASNGGTLDLSGLTNSSLANVAFDIVDFGYGHILDGELTSFNNCYISTDGTDTDFDNSITNLDNGGIAATYDTGTASFPNLTNIDDSGLSADSGATLVVTGVTSYRTSGNSRGFSAMGAGSDIELPHLATFTVVDPLVENNGITFSATEGGKLDLASLDNSIFKALSVRLTDTGNGEILSSGLTSPDNATVTTDGTDANFLNQITSLTNSALNVTGGNLSLPNLTDINGTNINVSGGASLLLPGITSYNSDETFPGNKLSVDGSDSELDLSSLSQITCVSHTNSNFVLNFSAADGGTLNLSGLTDNSFTANLNVDFTDTGSSKIIDPGLTQLNNVNVSLDVDGTDSTFEGNFQSITNGLLYVSSGNATLPNLTDIDGSSLDVYNGFGQSSTSLSLPSLTSYNNTYTSNYAFFSFGVYGSNSELDLSSLSQITCVSHTNSNFVLNFSAADGGTLNLSGLTDNSYTANLNIDFTDTGSSKIIDPGLTQLNNVGVSITTDGTDATFDDNWQVIDKGSISVQSGNVSLQNLTNIDGTSLFVTNGATLSLPAVTSYNTDGYYVTFSADGFGSLLNLSALTQITNSSSYGSINFTAGNGAALNISSLNAISLHQASISDTDNSTFIDGKLSSLRNVYITTDGTDAQFIDQLTSLTDSSLNVTGGNLSLPSLIDIDGSAVYVYNGAKLSLPSVTSYDSYDATAEGYLNNLSVDGNGSQLSLAYLSTLTSNSSYPNADILTLSTTGGGDLEIPNITSRSFASDPPVSITDTGNSTLNVGAITTISSVNISTDGTNVGFLNGLTSLTDSTLNVNGGDLSLPNLTNIDATGIMVTNGAHLALPNVTSYDANSANAYYFAYDTFSVDGVGSQLDLSNLSSISNLATITSADAPMAFEASHGGKLDLSNLTNAKATNSFLSFANYENSQIIDPDLASFDNVNITLFTDGTDAGFTDAFNSLIDSTLNVVGGTVTLPNLSDIDGSSIYVNYGASLSLQGVIGFSDDNNPITFSSDGIGSVLDLSSLQTFNHSGALGTFNLSATNGGAINLANMTTSSLSGGSITDTGNSSIQYPALDTLGNFNITLDGTDTNFPNSLTSLTESTLNVTGGTSSLLNLTNIDGTSIAVINGASLTLPGVTSFYDGNRQITFSADGTSSLLDLSSLQTFTQGDSGSLTVSQTNGGVVNLFATVFPDLSATNITASSANTGVVTVAWNDVNSDAANVTSSFDDQVQLVDVTDGGVVLDTATVHYNEGASGPITANGGQAAQQVSFNLASYPQFHVGDTLTAVIAVDAHDNVVETNKQNNNATIYVTQAPYPNLQVTDLGATGDSTGNVTINWNDTNAGPGVVTQNFNDALLVTDSLTGATIYSGNILYNAAANAINSGASVAQTLSFQLPTGFNVADNLAVTVTADSDDNVFESSKSNNTSVYTTNAPLAQYPDLQVQNLAISPTNPQSGQQITINWNDANIGAGPANGSWNDSILVVNTTTGQTLLATNQDVPANSLSSGGTMARAYSLTLPNGDAGAGTIQVTVTVNSNNNVFEYNSSRTATSNNTSAVEITSIAPSSDLTVQNLQVTPAAPSSGQPLTISWNDANVGTASTVGSWVDQVTVLNQTTSQTLLSQTVAYNSGIASNGNIQPGDSREQAVTFTLPDYSAGAGNLLVTVKTNANNGVFEENPGNNAASTGVVAALSPYPVLLVSGVTASASALPGQQVSITYSITNIGTGPAVGPWTDAIEISPNTDGSNASPIGYLQNTGTLNPSQSADLTGKVTIPATSSGSNYFVIQTDSNTNLKEIDRSGNIAVASQVTSVLASLQLAIGAQTIRKNAGVSATSGTITRSGNLTQPLTVSLQDSDAAITAVPATVTILAGNNSANFTIGAIDDGLVDGDQLVTVTGSASGYQTTSSTFTVKETDQPALTLSINNTTFSEAAGNTAATATLTRNTSTANALTVSLLSDHYTKVILPASVTIPAGQSAVTFALTAVNDGLIDGPVNVTISASAAGMNSGVATVTVTDVNVPTLSLSLSSSTVGENAANPAANGTITLNRPQNTIVAISLFSSNVTAATVPQVVYVPAGQTTVSFNINAVDDGIVDADKNVVISAKVTTYGGVVLNQGMATAALKVLNADGPALTLSFASSAVSAGGEIVATVTRNTDTSTPLVVSLQSSDTTHATVPGTVTIPSGSASVTFNIRGMDDHLADGLQHADISATAPGFASGVATLGVTSVDLPDLTVNQVIAPSAGFDNGSMNISWTVSNLGSYSAGGSWLDQVFIDPLGGAPSNTPADTVAFNGLLAPTASYTQTDTIPFPSIVGNYTVRVVTDCNDNIQELSYSNNTGSSGVVATQASYHATVTPSAARVPNGTPIVLSGVATLTSNGQPATQVPVAVRILVNGSRRVLTATTDDSGNYSVVFYPLQNEAGEYTVAADDPGVTTDTPQASFEIVGLSASPSYSSVTVVPNTTATGQITLTNLSSTLLSGLLATATGTSTDVSVTLSVPQSVAGNGSVSLTYTINATGNLNETANYRIDLTTEQGATLSIPLQVVVVPLTPQLTTNPGYLNSGMVVGTQSFISFTIANTGGAPTGDLSVNIPSTAFLTLSSSSTIPSFAPGASSTVVLTLSPAANLPLELYTGSIGIGNAATGITVPYTFRAVTTATGDVHVVVDDDFTFQESGSRHVAGANVKLLDAYDNSKTIASGTTDSTGAILLPGVPAGPYTLVVQADQHGSYQATINVVPGITNEQEVFIARQFVSYSWVVQQTTIQDTYQIQLKTTFVADVPAPVVTVSAPSSIPKLAPGQTGTFNLTLTNQGLIAALGVTVTVPSDPEYTFTALTSDIGVLPAKSSVTVPISVTRNTTVWSGMIVDGSGNPLPGLKVYAEFTNGSSISDPIFVGITDSIGNVSFLQAQPGTYELIIPGYQISSGIIATVSLGTTTTAVVVANFATAPSASATPAIEPNLPTSDLQPAVTTLGTFTQNQLASTELAAYIGKSVPDGFTLVGSPIVGSNGFRAVLLQSNATGDLVVANQGTDLTNNPQTAETDLVGFGLEWNASNKALLNSAIQNYISQNPQAGIYFTGDSLGGSLAQLEAYDSINDAQPFASNVKGLFTTNAPGVYLTILNRDGYYDPSALRDVNTQHLATIGDIVSRTTGPDIGNGPGGFSLPYIVGGQNLLEDLTYSGPFDFLTAHNLEKTLLPLLSGNFDLSNTPQARWDYYFGFGLGYLTASTQLVLATYLQPTLVNPPSCTLTISATYYYVCGGNDVSHDFFTPINVPLRDCSAKGVSDAINDAFSAISTSTTTTTTRRGVGVATSSDIPPSFTIPSNCNPCLEHIAVNLAQFAFNESPLSIIGTVSDITNFVKETYETIQTITSSSTTNGDKVKEFLETILGDAGTIKEVTGTANFVVNDLAEVNTLYENAKLILDVVNACTPELGKLWKGILTDITGQSVPTDMDSYQPPAYSADPGDISKLETLYERFIAIINAEDTIFGGNTDWLSTSQTSTLQQWVAAFYNAIGDSSDGGSTITPAETATLLATTLPDTVTTSDAMELINRWNRSVSYWAQGFTSVSQVPAGDSTDFFDLDSINSAFQAASTAVSDTQSDGYSDPMAELQAVVKTAEQNVQGDGACATIKMQIGQTATLTRSAFIGTLTISNGESSGPLTNIAVNIQVTDANGNPVSGAFSISAPILGGALTAVDGTGGLPSLGSGTVQYTFIPTDAAAPGAPTKYYLGGTFSYTDPETNGSVTVSIFPSAITVYPQAQLKLNYFLQRDVIGDNPFTSQVEPSEPATLGLLITNVGKGAANNLAITTAQPQIVENDKGLLNNFQIVGTQVGASQVSPSLNIDFGNLAPGQTADATFLLESTIQGILTNFTATFTHSDALGGLDTSLISSIMTHTLIHAGNFSFSGSTGAQDYLAEDNANPQNLPDTVYLSDGTEAPVSIAQNVQSTAAALAGQYVVTATTTSGWSYIQLPDPGVGYSLYKVVRSDGTAISVSHQAWTTDRIFDAGGNAQTDYQLHILDDNSTGSYTVYYKPTTTISPQVSSIQQVANPEHGPISSLQVTFSEAIDPSTLTLQALDLTLNGGANLIDGSASITQNSSTTFTVDGLSDLTGSSGNYVFTVNAATVTDAFGDTGVGSLFESWATSINAPVIVSVGANNPTLRNTAVDSVQVVISEPIDPSTFDYHALSLSFNGGATNLINSSVAVVSLSDTTYQINGLSHLTAADGKYVLTVNAADISDINQNIGVGTSSDSWTKDSVGPSIATLQSVTQSSRNTIVDTLDVTFSEAIDPSTFTYQDITFSKTGGPNLVTADVSIKSLSPTEFQIGNFSNLIAPIDGAYTFTVNAAGIQDLLGNSGSGSAADTWTLLTTPPDAPTNLTINPDNGVSSTDGITNTGTVTLTGNLDATGLAVQVYEGLNSELAQAVVTGTTFSAALSLSLGAHALKVYAVDQAGNVSSSTYVNVFIDETPPTATFAAVTQAAPTSAVTSMQFTLSKPIDISTLGIQDLTLTLNGGPNLITNAVSISYVSGNTYQINGLSGSNSAAGQYSLTLNLAGIKDIAGNSGINSIAATWQVIPAISTATFSGLTASTQLQYGTSSVVVSGMISAGALLPASGEVVVVTLNGVIADAPINAQGGFAVSFITAQLPAAGSPYQISYSYAGDSNLSSASDDSTTTLTINPKALTLLVDSASKVYGQPNPMFSGSFTGFVNGDTASVVTGTPTFSTTAGSNSTVGAYQINASVSALSAANYSFSEVNAGSLTITAAGTTTIATPVAANYGSTIQVSASVSANAPSTATVNEGTITFLVEQGTTVIATLPAVAVVNGSATADLSATLATGNYSINALYADSSSSPNFVASESLPASLQVNQTTLSTITVKRGGFIRNRAIGKVIQTITLTNTGAALNGPVILALKGLTGGTLANASGSLGDGTEYVTLVPTGGTWAAGASMTFVLQFNDPSGTLITYNTNLLQG